MSPFDTHYLQYVYQKIGTFFYWRPFALASLASKTTIRFTCFHPLTSNSNCLLPRRLNLCHTFITHPRASLQTLDLNPTSCFVHRVHAFGLFPVPLCLTVLACVGKKERICTTTSWSLGRYLKFKRLSITI